MGLRVITGDFKKKKLFSVRGAKTRPTAGRLREAIFNILNKDVIDSMILDIFAGTGALGIEALSRGAGYVIFVEKSRAASHVIKQNIQLCKLENKTSVMTMDALKNLRCIKSITPFFDLVFMDPPYNKGFIIPTLINLHKSALLKKDSCIVVEHSDKENIPRDLAGYDIYDSRKYGNTVVSYLTYIE